MTEETPKPPQLSPIIIHLLKGILFRQQQPVLWNNLLSLQSQVLDYVKIIGLELEINDTEGYAWLKQVTLSEEEKKNPPPRLINRRPLSYHMSLLCVLLRRKIVEADSSGEETRVIVSREELINLMVIYMPEKTNETQTSATINAVINKVADLGFLRKLKNDTENLEIQRIISALVDADWVADLNEKLKTYQDHAKRTT
jgi:hypothetical protein